MRSLVFAALAVTGCAMAKRTETATTRTPFVGPVHLHGDGLPGTSALGADGTFTFTADAAALCEQDRGTKIRTQRVERERLSGAGIGMIAGGGLLVGVGGYGATVTEEPVPFIGLAVTGLLTSAIILAVRYIAPGTTRTIGGPGEQTAIDRTDRVACPPAVLASLGLLELQTPWGGLTQTTLDRQGVATFAVDWSAVPAADAAGARAAIAVPWQLRSAVGRVGEFVPRDAEIDRVLALGSETRDRVITGETPAALVVGAFQAEGAGLTIGGTGLLQLAVRNDGGSTAVDVIAKTRSGIAGLDNVVFAFGKVQPGKQVTRTVPVTIAATTRDLSAPVLVVITAGGAPQVEHSVALPLARTLCPGGKLTTKAYEVKRTRLQAVRDAGNITQQEFERYDAELLTCRE